MLSAFPVASLTSKKLYLARQFLKLANMSKRTNFSPITSVTSRAAYQSAFSLSFRAEKANRNQSEEADLMPTIYFEAHTQNACPFHPRRKRLTKISGRTWSGAQKATLSRHLAKIADGLHAKSRTRRQLFSDLFENFRAQNRLH
jgi:hypothetical protein